MQFETFKDFDNQCYCHSYDSPEWGVAALQPIHVDKYGNTYDPHYIHWGTKEEAVQWAYDQLRQHLSVIGQYDIVTARSILDAFGSDYGVVWCQCGLPKKKDEQCKCNQ